MYLKIKRVFDLIISLIVLIILLPVLILIAILLLLVGIKNPVFKQVRTGKNGNNFTIYKFTTIDNNNDIPAFCKFLRKSGLDEMLQLINVIKGDMSLIGPRPWIVDYSKYFTKKQKRRLEVLPGMTGLAQIRNTKNVFEKIEYDIYYVNNISIKMDIYIFFSSFNWILFGRKNEFSRSDIEGDLELLKKNKKGELWKK